MSTTSAFPGAIAKPAPFMDGKFAKRIVIACGIVPGLLLAYDAYNGNLGVNDINFAIRTTGLLGLVFLSLSLVITPLRRLTGWNTLLSIRRNLGVYGFAYIAAHFTIFFWYDRDGSVGSTLTEIVERVYLWFGTASLVIMIPLAITSTDTMVTKIGPKRWKLLHRLAYVAVLCGVIHYYLLVKADTTKPIVFAVVFGGLMLYRIAMSYVDLRREVATAKQKLQAAKQSVPKAKKFWSGELRVARIFQETPDVKTFRFVAPDGGPLPFTHTAGQYMNLALMIDGKRVNRSYTIASSPTRSAYCEISVKRDGLASKHLHANLKEGDTLKISAPAGKFFFAGHESERVVLVAGGVGITPMMAVIRSLTDRGWKGEVYLIFSVRKREDIIFDAELEYLKQRFPNLHVKVTLTGDPEAPWDGARGHMSSEMITSFVPDLKRGPVMLCGPEKMMAAARALFVALGVPDAEVLEEAFVSPPAPKEMADAAVATAAAVEIDEVANGEIANVTFRKAGKMAELPSELTVLEAAEECGVSIPFECRSGICGQCKTKLVSGRVTMENQDALTAGDRGKGMILACQARAVRDIVVDQ
ncbi:MAG: ferric reductase-like transmembrane domain-containing protein [Kofleriaceae bacterium]